MVQAFRAEADQPLESSFFCTLQEIRTASRTRALDTAVGIGFWFNNETRLIPKEALREVGKGVRRDGEPVVIHSFLAPTFCWMGSVTASATTPYLFKPFIQYAGTDGRTYRIWDPATDNYVLQYDRVKDFDRTSEVLR